MWIYSRRRLQRLILSAVSVNMQVRLHKEKRRREEKTKKNNLTFLLDGLDVEKALTYVHNYITQKVTGSLFSKIKQ